MTAEPTTTPTAMGAALMSTPTLHDELGIVRMLAACKTTSQVQRAYPALTSYQVEQIRDRNGGRRFQELRYAVARLEKKLAGSQEATDANALAAKAAGASPDPSQALVELPIAQVHPSPNNPREHLREIAELAASMKELGMIQPIVVQPRDAGGFQVVAGHRRLAAAKHLRWKTLFCLVRKPMRPDDELVTMLVENGQRARLDPIEEARAFKRMQAQGHTQDQIAERIGRSNAHVSMRISLLSLPIEEQERLRAGEIGITRAEQQAKLNSGRVRARGKPADRAWHFAHTHSLAARAEARCVRLQHKRGRRLSGGVACGECWESVIRADEREHLHEISAKTGRCGLCNEPSAKATS